MVTQTQFHVTLYVQCLLLVYLSDIEELFSFLQWNAVQTRLGCPQNKGYGCEHSIYSMGKNVDKGLFLA
jgi:hypothetical protein